MLNTIKGVYEMKQTASLDMERVFTHFAVADEDQAVAAYTLKRFNDFIIVISKFE